MKKTKLLILLFGLSLSIFLLLMKTPEGLTTQGQNALSVFFFAVTMWITGALPLPVTGISVFALLPLLKVLPTKTVFSLFGSNAVFFILGAFILAAAMMKTKLSRRFDLHFLGNLDRNPLSLFTGIFLICAFLAFWMPEHAVAALMLPVVLEIANGLNLTPQKENYGKILFLVLAWGSIIEARFVDEIIKVQEEENVNLVIASRPKGQLLPYVLSSYNIEELKKTLGEKLIIIEE